MGASCGVKRNTACAPVFMCACVCVLGQGCLQRGRPGGMAGIVKREEKVRQCKVFVVLMQGEDSCWEGSDAAGAPAKRRVCGGQGRGRG